MTNNNNQNEQDSTQVVVDFFKTFKWRIIGFLAFLIIAILFLLFGFDITLELMNTAIETAIDICMPEINPKAKLAKDTSAGAVLVVAIVAVVIGIIIFGPKILDLIIK